MTSSAVGGQGCCRDLPTGLSLRVRASRARPKEGARLASGNRGGRFWEGEDGRRGGAGCLGCGELFEVLHRVRGLLPCELCGRRVAGRLAGTENVPKAADPGAQAVPGPVPVPLGRAAGGLAGLASPPRLGSAPDVPPACGPHPSAPVFSDLEV